MLKNVVKNLIDNTLRALPAALGTALISVMPWAENYLSQIASNTHPRILVWTIAILAAVVAWSVSALLFMKFRAKYYFDEKTGAWIGSDAFHYCPKCKTSDINSPMRYCDSDQSSWCGWVCAACDYKLRDPEKPEDSRKIAESFRVM